MVPFKTRGGVANSVAGGKFHITSGLNIIYYEVKIRTGYLEGEFKNIEVCKVQWLKEKCGKESFFRKACCMC